MNEAESVTKTQRLDSVFKGDPSILASLTPIYKGSSGLVCKQRSSEKTAKYYVSASRLKQVCA